MARTKLMTKPMPLTGLGDDPQRRLNLSYNLRYRNPEAVGEFAHSWVVPLFEIATVGLTNDLALQTAGTRESGKSGPWVRPPDAWILRLRERYPYTENAFRKEVGVPLRTFYAY